MSTTREASKNRGRNRTRNASSFGRRGEGGLNFDHFADTRVERYSFHLIIGLRAWNAPIPGEPCPVCHDRYLQKKQYCAYCDRTGLDGRAVFPGERIGSRMDPHYRADPPAVPVTDPMLKGGRSGKFRTRSGEATKAKRRRRDRVG